MTNDPVRNEDDLATFQAERPRLLALAYRMLGELARAEDAVQDAWLRFTRRTEPARDPRAYLIAIVTRLCLNELASARARKEESRADRLPEPVDLEESGLFRIDRAEDVSIALLVALQRLTPAERAVLLLHDVFDFGHADIAGLVDKSPVACRKLLERARASIAAEKRLVSPSREEHARLLGAFVRAANDGDVGALVALLADDVELTTDGGSAGRVDRGGVRNLRAPLVGRSRVAKFLCARSARGAARFSTEVRDLNGLPALLLRENGEPFAALMLGIADGLVHRVYFQADPERLRRFHKQP